MTERMPTNHQAQTSVWIGYAAAIISVALLTQGLAAIEPFFPLNKFPIPFVLLTMIIAYYFGIGPAIAAGVFGWLAFTHFFVPPYGLWPLAATPKDWAEQSAFLLGVAVVVIAAVQVRKANKRIQQLADAATTYNDVLRTEMSERQEAEDELRKSREDLDHAQAVAQTGSWRLDVRNSELLWSDETYRIFGLATGTPLTYESFLSLIHPGDRAFVDQKWNAAMLGDPYDIEHRIVVGNDTKWVHERAELELDQNGQLMSAFGAVQDITERKLVQEELSHSRNELIEALEREKYFSLLLQQALLPRIPTLDSGYTVAAEYVPAFVNHQIGGDFYDVIPVGPAKVGILIGDVAGKGLEAAALAATTRSTIHAFVHETTLTGEVLARTNAVLCAQKPELEEFVTVFLAIIDQYTGEFNYSSAGHPPAMICRCGGKVDFLELGQTPLTVKDSEVFTECHNRLEPGDKIILYTDGISEARHDLIMLDFEGIARLLTDQCYQSSPDIAKSIISAATEWANGKLADDAAVVVFERIE